MELRNSLANWVLTGGIIVAFAALSMIAPSALNEDADQSPQALPQSGSPESNSDPDSTTQEDTSDPALVLPVPDAEPAPETVSGIFLDQLSICGSMTISNRPREIEDLLITNYRSTVRVNTVAIAIAPVQAGCFSSGFGPRGSSLHKGIDLHNPTPVTVLAAAAGTIKEQHYRDDYGNMIVIDHGNGVFSRYAHLERFEDGIDVYQRVEAGQPIGVMGNTASYRIPRHLHYEVLTGEWGALSGSFGLEPVDVMALLPEN